VVLLSGSCQGDDLVALMGFSVAGILRINSLPQGVGQCCSCTALHQPETDVETDAEKSTHGIKVFVASS